MLNSFFACYANAMKTLCSRFAINGSKKSETSCQGDFLRVTFGGCNGLSEKPYSLYCGDKFPQNTLISTTNKICLKFFSDDSGTDRGFSLNYTAIKAPGEASKVLGKCYTFLIVMVCLLSKC